MVKQQRRTDSNVSRVRFSLGPIRRTQPVSQQVPDRKGTGSGDGHWCCSATEEKPGDRQSQQQDPGAYGGSGGAALKRRRLDGPEEAGTLSNGERLPGSCDQPGESAAVLSRAPPPDQQGSAERCEESRAELQGVGSLKVTIQQSSESREFRRTDRTTDRQTDGLYCHVCNSSCSSIQAFQDHMAGVEHQSKLKEITQSVCLNAHTPHGRGHRPGVQRWCDTCQSHFSGDIILHRRTNQHKLCKQASRPFCPICQRHFRTPRKFVEHMKSPEHKQQVQLDDALEEELITVDAIGCFEGEEEEEEVEEVEVAEEEEKEVGNKETEEEVREAAETNETTDRQQYDPHTACGSSFVVPVSGFLCRLCHKFFHIEATARHIHCRTHTHYLNLQNHRTKRRRTHTLTDRHIDTHT